MKGRECFFSAIFYFSSSFSCAAFSAFMSVSQCVSFILSRLEMCFFSGDDLKCCFYQAMTWHCYGFMMVILQLSPDYFLKWNTYVKTIGASEIQLKLKSHKLYLMMVFPISEKEKGELILFKSQRCFVLRIIKKQFFAKRFNLYHCKYTIYIFEIKLNRTKIIFEWMHR